MKFTIIIIFFFSFSLSAQQYKFENGKRVPLTELEKTAIDEDRKEARRLDSIETVQDSIKYSDIDNLTTIDTKFQNLVLKTLRQQRTRINNLQARIRELENAAKARNR